MSWLWLYSNDSLSSMFPLGLPVRRMTPFTATLSYWVHLAILQAYVPAGLADLVHV